MVTEENRRLAFRTQRLALRCLTMDDAPLLFEQQNNPTVIQYMATFVYPHLKCILLERRLVSSGIDDKYDCHCRNSPGTNPHLRDPQPWSIDEVRNGLSARLVKNHLHLLICLLPDDQHLETPAGMSPFDPSLRFPSITPDSITGISIGNGGMKDDYGLGYLIAHEHWGKGFATEAVAGILREVWRGAAEGRFGRLPIEKDNHEHHGREYVMATVKPENRASARVLEKNGGVDAGFMEFDDFDQTSEEKESGGVRKFKLQAFRVYRPESTSIERI